MTPRLVHSEPRFCQPDREPDVCSCGCQTSQKPCLRLVEDARFVEQDEPLVLPREPVSEE